MEALQRRRDQARAVNESLSRHLVALDQVMQQNAAELHDAMRAAEAAEYLHALQADARTAKRGIDAVSDGPTRLSSPSSGPGA